MRKQSKKTINLASYLLEWPASGGCSFLPSCQLQVAGRGAGSEQGHFNSQAERQVSPRQAIMYDCSNNKSNMESKSKKQFQHGVATDFSLQQCVTHR